MGSAITCPCCDLPTLPCRVAAICSVCWWESDPIQDAGDQISSGPNHGYTLRQARTNFRDHGHMYDRGDEIAALRGDCEGRQRLLAYVQDLKNGQAELDADTLNQLLTRERACRMPRG